MTCRRVGSQADRLGGEVGCVMHQTNAVSDYTHAHARQPCGVRRVDAVCILQGGAAPYTHSPPCEMRRACICIYRACLTGRGGCILYTHTPCVSHREGPTGRVHICRVCLTERGLSVSEGHTHLTRRRRSASTRLARPVTAAAAKTCCLRLQIGRCMSQRQSHHDLPYNLSEPMQVYEPIKVA